MADRETSNPGTDRYLVWCPMPPCKYRTAPTIERAEAIARKFAEEADQAGGPVFIYERIAQARKVVEVHFQSQAAPLPVALLGGAEGPYRIIQTRKGTPENG